MRPEPCYMGPMFGLGMGEIIIILVLALVLLGADKLPEAAKQLGKGLREFRKATDDLKSQFDAELYAPKDKDKQKKPNVVDPNGPYPPCKPEEPAQPAPEASAEPPDQSSGGARPSEVAPPAPEAPVATADNVPGLEAALAEPPPDRKRS